MASMIPRILPDLLLDLPGGDSDRPLLRYRHDGVYRQVTAGEFRARTFALAAGLEQLGVGRGDRVILIAENRPEWPATDFAALLLGAVTVPVYPSLPAAQIAHHMTHSGARVAVVSNRSQLEKVAPHLGGDSGLERIVVMDPGADSSEQVVAWNDVVAAGEKAAGDAAAWRQRSAGIDPDSIATILYTSGTTGLPKGVALTHRGLCANLVAILDAIPFRADDTVLSYLPLSHVFQRVVDFICFLQGATIAYAALGDTLMDDFHAAAPTVVPTVPRILEKMEAAVRARVALAPRWRRWLFARAEAAGRCRWADGEQTTAPSTFRYRVARRWVLDPLRTRLVGQSFRFFVSGSAALPLEVAKFFTACGIEVLQGYGLTETPVISVNRPDRNRLGTVGPVLNGVEIRIAADGEILTRGPQVMDGYYRDPESTRQVLPDGWFHTGDIGRLDADGFLSITDRKKDLLKTSGGKLVAPQPLENRLREDDLIGEAIVIGDGRRFIAALIVPDFDCLERLAAERGIGAVGRTELLQHPKILMEYDRRIAARLAGIASFESVKKFRLLPEPLRLEEGELTPSMKVRRARIAEKYADEIEAMYR